MLWLHSSVYFFSSMDNAAFRLSGYQFDRVILNLEHVSKDLSLDLSFAPKGSYNPCKGTYLLTFVFTAFCKDRKIVEVLCRADFVFQNKLSIEEIPSYFYANSIAILFPYVRAFVSTLTLQANITPLVLPTLNFTDLQAELRANTIVE